MGRCVSAVARKGDSKTIGKFPIKECAPFYRGMTEHATAQELSTLPLSILTKLRDVAANNDMDSVVVSKLNAAVELANQRLSNQSVSLG